MFNYTSPRSRIKPKRSNNQLYRPWEFEGSLLWLKQILTVYIFKLTADNNRGSTSSGALFEFELSSAAQYSHHRAKVYSNKKEVIWISRSKSTWNPDGVIRTVFRVTNSTVPEVSKRWLSVKWLLLDPNWSIWLKQLSVDTWEAGWVAGRYPKAFHFKVCYLIV